MRSGPNRIGQGRSGWRRNQLPLLIMPAPTVTPVASSITMNEPVVRFFKYARRAAHGSGQLDAADLVETDLLGVLVGVQAVDVEAVLDALDHCAIRAGRVLERQLLARTQNSLPSTFDNYSSLSGTTTGGSASWPWACAVRRLAPRRSRRPTAGGRHGVRILLLRCLRLAGDARRRRPHARSCHLRLSIRT
jgi:hypothetical protein